MGNDQLAESIDEVLKTLDNYEVPEPITVNVETDEDRKFWLMMKLHGYIE